MTFFEKKIVQSFEYILEALYSTPNSGKLLVKHSEYKRNGDQKIKG